MILTSPDLLAPLLATVVMRATSLLEQTPGLVLPLDGLAFLILPPVQVITFINDIIYYLFNDYLICIYNTIQVYDGSCGNLPVYLYKKNNIFDILCILITAICSDLPVPDNGIVVVYNTMSFPRPSGTVANFSCVIGYAVFGNTTRTCQDNTEWSGGDIVCERKFVYLL